jgi:hypothetical protein
LICFNIEDEKYVLQKVYETKAAFYALRTVWTAGEFQNNGFSLIASPP